MSDISKLELRLMKKKDQLVKLQGEIKELEDSLQEEKEARIVKAIRKVSLTNTQYKTLEKSVRNKTVFDFLEKLEKEQMEGVKE